MADTTLPGVLLKGVAASRPAANAVAKGTIYSATDTGAISQSDASSWSTFAQAGGSTAAPQFATIELGNASDTTLSRASAGVVAVEGTNLLKAGGVVETDLAGLTDITTANASTSKHGLLRKLDNTAAHYLDGTGAWSTPGISAAGLSAGTSFPGSPSTSDLFHRTDLACGLFKYDGTRWRCTALHEVPLSTMDANLAFSASGGVLRGQVPIWNGSDIWVVAAQSWFFVNGGASALSGSHKWVGVLVKTPAATTLDTVTIDSGASGAFRQSPYTAIGALLGTTNFEFEITWTKTGTPGVLYTKSAISYNHVAV